MLTGQLVFDEPTAMKVLVAHANKRPPTPSSMSEHEIPLSLDEIVLDCLNKSPDDRPQSAAELAERLDAVAFDQPWTPQCAEEWWRTVRPAA
jgi:serine/threonine-protein kinase